VGTDPGTVPERKRNDFVTRARRPYTGSVLEESTRDVTLEPLDDWIVVEPLDDSETASGLIVPINEGAQTRQAIVAAVGPEVDSIEPGDKVLFPRDAGFEVRLARSAHRVRVLKRENLLARIHD
jgi:co-chaperonin GroES (HSP10)